MSPLQFTCMTFACVQNYLGLFGNVISSTPNTLLYITDFPSDRTYLCQVHRPVYTCRVLQAQYPYRQSGF